MASAVSCQIVLARRSTWLVTRHQRLAHARPSGPGRFRGPGSSPPDPLEQALPERRHPFSRGCVLQRVCEGPHAVRGRGHTGFSHRKARQHGTGRVLAPALRGRQHVWRRAVDRLQGRGGSRRVKRLYSLAEMLAVFHNAACAEADHATLAATAEALLGLATHAFGRSLAAEGDRWGVYRHHHPILVRREARHHLVQLAARSSAARQRLLAAARGRITLEDADLNAAEVALVALQHLDLARLDGPERYQVSRTLVEILVDSGNFWTQLAAVLRHPGDGRAGALRDRHVGQHGRPARPPGQGPGPTRDQDQPHPGRTGESPGLAG
jgi:hypothetical protein